MLVYPPGIGTVLPGERLDERAKPMLDYFKMFEASANLFPGFEAEIQGVYREVDPDGRIRFHTYVLREGPDGAGRALPEIVIRPSSDADVAAMIAIYEHHIAKGVGDAGDFEEERLLPDDLKRRRKTMRKKRLPHLVAERNGEVAGYAYAVPFRKRPAYRYTLKHSIYVHHAT